jgi:tetrathionate reductase subunit A
LIQDTGIERWVWPKNQISPAQLRSTFARALQFPGQVPHNPTWMTYRYGQGGVECKIYNADVATAHNSITGELASGTARYAPLRDFRGRKLDELDPPSRFPLVLSTHKDTNLSHSYAVADPWLMELMPEGFIEMCPSDAARLGLHEGDQVRVWSSTIPRERGIVGRLRLLHGLRVGVITFPHGYGHWAYGAGSWTVNGKTVTGDDARNVPVRLNAVMRLDSSIAASDGWSVGLMDPIAGGQAYYGTRVAVERV